MYNSAMQGLSDSTFLATCMRLQTVWPYFLSAVHTGSKGSTKGLSNCMQPYVMGMDAPKQASAGLAGPENSFPMSSAAPA